MTSSDPDLYLLYSDTNLVTPDDLDRVQSWSLLPSELSDISGYMSQYGKNKNLSKHSIRERDGSKLPGYFVQIA